MTRQKLAILDKQAFLSSMQLTVLENLKQDKVIKTIDQAESRMISFFGCHNNHT